MRSPHAAATALLLLSYFPVAGCRHQDAPSVTRPTTATAVSSRPMTLPSGPVAAVWYDVGYPPPGMALIDMRRLIVGVWGDGRVVWSDNRATGGGKYHVARTDPKRVAKLLDELHAAGFFDEKREVNMGPDASYTVLAADDGSRRKRIESWHEPAPKNPNVVVNEHGMSVAKPGEPPPPPSPQYAQFLKVWADSRRLIETVVPDRGEMLDALDLEVFNLGRGSK